VTLRVLHYHPRALDGDGGATLVVRKLAEAAAATGADVTVACDSAADGRLERDVRYLPVEHRGTGRLRRPVGLRALISEADVVVLHSGWVPYNVAAARFARAAGVPYVLTPHGAYHERVRARRRALKSAWFAVAERRLLRRAAAVHVFFDEERKALELLMYSGPVIVVRSPLDSGAAPTWTGGGGYHLWLGRYDVETKGLDLLLEALALLPASERPRLRLHGHDHRHGRREAAALVDALGLGEWVSVAGPVRGGDKDRLLARADAFVHTSRFDSCPTVVAEAALAGVPTLVTPFPLGRLLAAGGGAVLAEPTAADIADGIRRLRRGDSAALGAAGARIARLSFSAGECGAAWLAQVEELV
jgi:glycosyltransferase involved in cell wall biosynthesis